MLASEYYQTKISTHTPQARRDCHFVEEYELYSGFQLTRLKRGATIAVNVIIVINSISTHTPQARRDYRRKRQ